MLYILSMRQNLLSFQKKVLKILSGRIDDFYLGGGTALSLYYFHHRESLDLDFFTQDFSKIRVLEIIQFLSAALDKKIERIGEESRRGKVKILVYSIPVNKNHSLKLDFIQDYLKPIKPPRLINGIKILSLEDIYQRKIYALLGTLPAEDSLGRRILKGGRQEAKDFYDVYCLSQIFMKLSDFAFRYGNPLVREALIRWFSAYDRMEIKTGLLELRLNKDIDYYDMERHFKKEVHKILDKEIDFL